MKVYSLSEPSVNRAEDQHAGLLVIGSWCYEGDRVCHTIRCEPYLVELSSTGILTDFMWAYAGQTILFSQASRQKLLFSDAELDYKEIVARHSSNASPRLFENFLRSQYRIMVPKVALKIDITKTSVSNIVYCEKCGKRYFFISGGKIVFRGVPVGLNQLRIFTSNELGPNSSPIFLTESGVDALGEIPRTHYELLEVGLIYFD
jgi:hypothetical protein